MSVLGVVRPRARPWARLWVVGQVRVRVRVRHTATKLAR